MSKVLIVGAGIGGLTLAAGLKQRGLDVTVVERAPAFKPVGAGISLQPNATAVLLALDIPLSEAAAAVMGPASFTDAAGRAFMNADASELVTEEAPAWNVHRADLHRALLEACGERSGAARGGAVTLRLGTAVASLEERGDEVAVTFEDGSAGAWSLVIGADGLSSTVREALLGDAGPRVRYSGQTCWRFAASTSVTRESSVEIWAPGKRAGLIQLSEGRIYCYLVASAPEGTPGPGSNEVAMLREQFGWMNPDLETLLSELTPETVVHHGDLCDLDGATWGRGRVVLMGDAAHAVQPNMGQGAAMAIEDAGALTLLITEHLSEPSGLVSAFQSAREARVREVWGLSWRIGQVAHWENPLARAVRNLALRSMPTSMMLKKAAESWQPGIDIARSLRA